MSRISSLFIRLEKAFAHPNKARDELAFERVSGRGSVATYSVVHRTFAPGFRIVATSDGAPFDVLAFESSIYECFAADLRQMPAAEALLAASGPATPSMAPLPNSSGFREKLFSAL